MKGLKPVLLRTFIPLFVVSLLLIALWCGYSTWSGNYDQGVSWLRGGAERTAGQMDWLSVQYWENIEMYEELLSDSNYRVNLPGRHAFLSGTSDGIYKIRAMGEALPPQWRERRFEFTDFPKNGSGFLFIDERLVFLVLHRGHIARNALLEVINPEYLEVLRSQVGGELSFMVDGKIAMTSWMDQENEFVEPICPALADRLEREGVSESILDGKVFCRLPEGRGYRGFSLEDTGAKFHVADTGIETFYAALSLSDPAGRPVGHFVFQVPENALLSGPKMALFGSGMLVIAVAMIVIAATIRTANRYINPITSVVTEMDVLSANVTQLLDGERIGYQQTGASGELLALQGALHRLQAVVRMAEESDALRRKREDELREAKRETDMILDNIRDGLFLLDRSGRIGSQYSRILSSIFEKESLARLDFSELLETMAGEQKAALLSPFLELMFQKRHNEAVLAGVNPLRLLECRFHGGDNSIFYKHLEFHFHRIVSTDGSVDTVLAIVRDVSDRMLMKQELREADHRSKLHAELLHSVLSSEPSIISDFMGDMDSELRPLEEFNEEGLSREERADALPGILSALHTIKGNASVLGLAPLAVCAHKHEERVMALHLGVPEADRESPVLALAELRSLRAEVGSIIEKVKLFRDEFGRSGDVNGRLLDIVERTVRGLWGRHLKQIRFSHERFDHLSLPGKYRRLFRDVLVQLVRNAVTHGIEPPAERKARGKPYDGSVDLFSVRSPGRFEFGVRDDGRGLQLKRLREKALASGLSEREFDSESRLVFMRGLSTAEGADIVRGRGVGLDMVRNRVEEAGGSIHVSSQEGLFCEITVSLPL